MDDCICGNLILTSETKHVDYEQCSICHSNYCNDCRDRIQECDMCEAMVCESCENTCEKCGKVLCDKCTVMNVNDMSKYCTTCYNDG